MGEPQKGDCFSLPAPVAAALCSFCERPKNIRRKVYGYIHGEQILRRQLQSYRELIGKSAGAKPFLNFQGKEY
jgi:hypothetical protein